MVTFGVITNLIAYANRPEPTQPSTTNTQPVKTRVYTTNELLAEANKLRADKGVAPLKLDERLNQSAQWKADDMKKHDYYGHVREGYRGYEKIRELAPECGLVGENLAGTFPDGSPFYDEGWVDSKAHYDAIIDSKYTHTGFGVMTEADGYKVYVQHFCSI